MTLHLNFGDHGRAISTSLDRLLDTIIKLVAIAKLDPKDVEQVRVLCRDLADHPEQAAALSLLVNATGQLLDKEAGNGALYRSDGAVSDSDARGAGASRKRPRRQRGVQES